MPHTAAEVATRISEQLVRMADRDPEFHRGDLADMLKTFTVPELARYLATEGIRLRSNADRAETVAAVLDIHTPEQAVEPPAPEVLSIATVTSLGAIIEAAITGSRVARLIEGGNVAVGTARSIGDQNGNFLNAKTDVRQAYLRVTLVSGFEAFWPVMDLVPEQQSGYFVTDYKD